MLENKVDVPEGKKGEWSVEHFVVNEEDEKLGKLRAIFSGRGRFVPAGTYTALKRNGATVMTDTPDEIGDHRVAIQKAKGNCLINGLGLGVVLKAILEKSEVKHVTVIEKSAEVIALVGLHYKKQFDSKLTIINADALDWKPPKGTFYGMVWHDIWNDICSDNLPEMHRLHRKYGKRSAWQGSWCRGLCPAE